MKVTVTVEGLRELDKALSAFTERKRRSIGRKALDSGGQITAKAARALAPVDEGDLREGIDVSGTLSRRQRSQHQKRSEQERFVGPGTHPQAHLREFGGDGHAPDPYMRPAWDQTKNQVLQRIGDELWLGVEKEVKRAARRAARGQ